MPNSNHDNASTIKIMPLGDSLTYGNYAYGENGTGGYRTHLWRKLQDTGYTNIDFVGSVRWGPADIDPASEGRPGWEIEQISTNVESWLHRYNPDLILLMIGTNDILQNTPLETLLRRMEHLLRQIANACPAAHLFVAALIGVRMPNEYGIRLDDILAFNEQLPDLVQSLADAGQNISFVDMYDRAGLGNDDFGADGVHPNDSGYTKIANVWYEVVITHLPNAIR